MATLPGALVTWSAHQEPPTWSRSPELDEYQPVTWPFAARHLGTVAVGTRTDTQPVDEPQELHAGAAVPNFGADWYRRVHVLPAALDLGNLVATVERAVEVWNAWFLSGALEAIDEAGTEGLSLAGQPSPPLMFGPLQSRIYDFTATTRGPAVIDALFTFRFEAGISALLNVVGRRVVVWGIPPDWSGGVLERREWLTEVLEAHDGSEQRIRLRAKPRVELEYAVLEQGHAARLLAHLLFGWGARVYCLPVWMEVGVLTAPLAPGAQALTVPGAAEADFHAGGFLVLWRDRATHLAAEIASVDGDTLTLVQPLGSGWPAGTRVYPARMARLLAEVGLTRPTAAVVQGRVRFRGEEPASPEPLEVGPAYQGYQVFEWRPDRSDDLEESWRRQLTELDNATGLPWQEDRTGAPVTSRKLTWLLTDRAAAGRFRQWLAAWAGRCNPCWLPTFGADLEVTRAVGAAEAGLTVRNTLYARLVATHPRRRDLGILTRDGQWHYRRITGATELSDEEEYLALDASFGVALEPGDFVMISFLELSRLDQDAVEIAWETDQVARAALTVRGVSQ